MQDFFLIRKASFDGHVFFPEGPVEKITAVEAFKKFAPSHSSGELLNIHGARPGDMIGVIEKENGGFTNFLTGKPEGDKETIKKILLVNPFFFKNLKYAYFLVDMDLSINTLNLLESKKIKI